MTQSQDQHNMAKKHQLLHFFVSRERHETGKRGARCTASKLNMLKENKNHQYLVSVFPESSTYDEGVSQGTGTTLKSSSICQLICLVSFEAFLDAFLACGMDIK